MLLQRRFKGKRFCAATVTVQGAEMFDTRSLAVVGWFGKILQSWLVNERVVKDSIDLIQLWIQV